MEYEFDPLKSESNREKHGVDFVQAQELWQEPHAHRGACAYDGRAAVACGRPDGRQALVGCGDLPGGQDQDHLCPPGTG